MNFNVSTRPIQESFQESTQECKHKSMDKSCVINKVLQSTNPHLFSNLNSAEIENLRISSFKELQLEKPLSLLKRLERPFSLLSCVNCSNKKPIPRMNKNLIKLAQEIRARCLEEPGMFRREGSKARSTEIYNKLVENQFIDFKDWTILELGSGFKKYIRDYLDGLFTDLFIDIALKYLKEHKREDLHRVSKCFLFSLSCEMRDLFMEIQGISKKLTENVKESRMTLESIANILCLTLTPQGVFKSIEIIEDLKEIVKQFLVIDFKTI